MANWLHKLDIKEEWEDCADDKISFRVLAGVIADKLSKIDFKNEDFNFERDDIVFNFRDLAKDDKARVGEFDSLMDELYDFADTELDDNFNGDKLLWVGTF